MSRPAALLGLALAAACVRPAAAQPAALPLGSGLPLGSNSFIPEQPQEIGRASCRERVYGRV